MSMPPAMLPAGMFWPWNVRPVGISAVAPTVSSIACSAGVEFCAQPHSVLLLRSQAMPEKAVVGVVVGFGYVFTVVAVPRSANVLATYAGVAVKASGHVADAQRFLDWLAGPAGQALLAGFGFLPPS